MELFGGDDKYKRLTRLREGGYEGPVDGEGRAVMSRTGRNGKPLELLKGGTGTGTPDEDRARAVTRAMEAAEAALARRIAIQDAKIIRRSQRPE